MNDTLTKQNETTPNVIDFTGQYNGRTMPEHLLYTLLGLRVAVETTESKQNRKRYVAAFNNIYLQLTPATRKTWFETYDLRAL